jgi:hypothetical protein
MKASRNVFLSPIFLSYANFPPPTDNSVSAAIPFFQKKFPLYKLFPNTWRKRPLVPLSLVLLLFRSFKFVLFWNSLPNSPPSALSLVPLPSSLYPVQPFSNFGSLSSKTSFMKKIAFVIVGLLAAAVSYGQEQTKSLSHFTKIVASPKINLVLEKGDSESIRLLCNNIAPEKVIVEVIHGKLHIYLEEAKIIEKRKWSYRNDYESYKTGMYAGVSVTAYVSFKQLTSLEKRGEEEVVCQSDISSDKFKIRAYGETEITLQSLKTKKLKISLYGENNLKIMTGSADRQVYRVFGENKVDTRGMSSYTASTRIYGEGRLSLNASEEVRITGFGEPNVTVKGDAHISKLVIGEARINRQH